MVSLVLKIVFGIINLYENRIFKLLKLICLFDLAVLGLRSTDKQYWSIRTCHGRDEDTVPTWLTSDRKLSDHSIKCREFIFLPRVYPEAWHELSNAFAIELLFLSVKKAVYMNELRFTDATKDALAGCALQVGVRNLIFAHEIINFLIRMKFKKYMSFTDYFFQN